MPEALVQNTVTCPDLHAAKKVGFRLKGSNKVGPKPAISGVITRISRVKFHPIYPSIFGHL